MGENVYMLPSDMSLNITSGTVGYNNKILVSDGTFSLGKNSKVNTFELAKINHKAVQPTITHKKLAQKPTNAHNAEKIALIILVAGVLAIWTMFQ